MLAKVIKPFAFYADGITPENLNVGDERDFGSMTAGLEKAGYVSVDSLDEDPVDPSAEPAAEPEGQPDEDEHQAAGEAQRRGRRRKQQ